MPEIDGKNDRGNDMGFGIGSLLGAAGGPWGAVTSLGLGLLGNSMKSGMGPANALNQQAQGDYGNIANNSGSLQTTGNYFNQQSIPMGQDYNNAVNNEAKFWQNDPWSTSTGQSALTNQRDAMTGNTQASLQGANAGLTQNLARRGLDGDSSELAGGIAGNEAQFNGQQAQSQNYAAGQDLAWQQQRAAALPQIYGQAAQFNNGIGTQDLGQSSQGYGQVGNFNLGLADQAAQMIAARNNNITGQMNGAAGMIGQMTGQSSAPNWFGDMTANTSQRGGQVPGGQGIGGYGTPVGGSPGSPGFGMPNSNGINPYAWADPSLRGYP